MNLMPLMLASAFLLPADKPSGDPSLRILDIVLKESHLGPAHVAKRLRAVYPGRMEVEDKRGDPISSADFRIRPEPERGAFRKGEVRWKGSRFLEANLRYRRPEKGPDPMNARIERYTAGRALDRDGFRIVTAEGYCLRWGNPEYTAKLEVAARGAGWCPAK